MAGVSLKGVTKSFGKTEVVHGVDLDIADGEFLVLVGPSGCGKSTILRMIAGLETVTSGELSIDGALVNDLEPKDRDIAMVFQNYALYPHMSVRRNMAYGLKVRKMDSAEIDRRVEEAADTLGLEAYLNRKPRELSGGQRQRVAMGRAIVRDPSVFLLDEPLSNLDAKLRNQMRVELKRLHQRLANTFIYVTHDQVEAMTLGQRIMVMNGGNVEQVGTPSEIYNHPESVFVAAFMGSPAMNILSGRVEGESVHIGEKTRLAFSGDISGRGIRIGIRPEHLFLHGGSGAEGCSIEARVELVEPLGGDTVVHCTVIGESDDDIVVRLHPDEVLTEGEIVSLSFKPDSLHFFDSGNGRRISGVQVCTE